MYKMEIYCQNLLINCVAKNHKFQIITFLHFPDNFFPDNSPTMDLSPTAKPKQRSRWVPFNNERKGCNGFTHKMVRLLGLCEFLSKLADYQCQMLFNFCNQKVPQTKLNLAISEFQRKEAFARCLNEFLCTDLAYVDKMANLITM